MARKKSGRVEEVVREPEPPPVLPTREEILSLPFWPRVAFCARAARRVLPLVAHCWETVVTVKYLHHKYHLTGTKKCVTLTERAAAKGSIVSEQALYDSRSAAGIAASQSEYAADLAGREKDVSPQYAASWAANSAHLAATAAFLLLKPDWNLDFYHPAWYASQAATIFGAGAAVDLAIRADFERVKKLVADKGWTNETPVSSKVFGPLWPDGAPANWPEDK